MSTTTVHHYQQDEKKKLCRNRKMIVQPMLSDLAQGRKGFIFSSNKKWVNGTNIKYMFIEGARNQQDVVRSAFQKWKDVGIGISFTEVRDIEDSIVRIGFNLSDGSWSYVGRDILTIPKSQRTMNFGWDLTNDYGTTTALHEIGHTIGFQHEHQNNDAGIVWNTAAVYKEFMQAPNSWSKAEIDSNILEKFSPDQVDGSRWDPESIMQYEFGPGLVAAPAPYDVLGVRPPGTLSQNDIDGVRKFYPLDTRTQPLTLLRSAAITVKSGGQADFTFTPQHSRKYTFQTFGEMDTVMVVSERGADEDYHMSGDDDSGFDKNTKISLPLIKGREYVINVRVLYTANENGAGIIVF